ncbi:Hypothetical predicted protein [Pelobates cultripes]|uniref:Uncharacterized protein n=1 Tax=Pelobates cultripes TaxID=61616 RepID=A0AAD1VM05_PELCU|nr:Hypothetical predicted protein [Pelobates cultripes]
MDIADTPEQPMIKSTFRVWKSATAPNDASRDIIALTRDIAVRTAIMNRSREMGTMQCKGHAVAIYADITFSVLVEMRKLAPIARRLRDHSMKYCWGIDGSLLVDNGEETIMLTSERPRTSPAGTGIVWRPTRSYHRDNNQKLGQ